MARSTLSSTIFLSAINFSETFQLQLLIKDSLTDLQLLGKFLGSQVEESVFDLVILSPTRRCQPKHNGLYLTHQRLSLMRTGWKSDGLSLAKIRGVRGHCPASPAWWTIKQFTNFTKVKKTFIFSDLDPSVWRICGSRDSWCSRKSPLGAQTASADHLIGSHY